MDRIALQSLKGPEHPFKSGVHGNGWAGGSKSGSGGTRPGHPLPAWSRVIRPPAIMLLLLNLMVTGLAGSAIAHEREEPDEIFRDTFQIIVSPPQVTRPLNDTGIDWCADDDSNNLDCPVASHPGQDGDHGRDALAREGLLDKVGAGAAGFDYTKLDANGNDLPASASEWTCVRDNHTGLVWEVKTTDGGLRDKDNTYTWYNPDSNVNGGDPGEPDGGDCTGSDCDTLGFTQAVNAQGLCGASDWRMPTLSELHSLAHRGRKPPAIDIDYFPNTPTFDNAYWSAIPIASGASPSAMLVIFNSGRTPQSSKSNDLRVRLVRGGP